ncbi:hypothetical protein [Alteribacter populi]|uniref:hypothetical protein n=1 Tax=Alteribacter populi TaxID=2011011 RepID=UPI000BBA5BA6|nr:hypothetical protein [Alteribacter populi]
MKRMKYCAALFVLLGVTSCSVGEDSASETEQTVYTYQEETNISYEGDEIVPSSYQLSIPQSFTRVKNIEVLMPEQMFFLREHEDIPFAYHGQNFRTIREDQASLVMEPQKKFFYHLFYHPDLDIFSEEPSEEEQDAMYKEARQAADSDSEEQVKKFKKESITGGPGVPLLGEDEWNSEEFESDKDIGPYEYIVKFENDGGFDVYELFGESEDDYLKATVTIPTATDEYERILEEMLDVLHTQTYELDEDLVEEPTGQEERKQTFSYTPLEKSDVPIPETSFSFELENYGYDKRSVSPFLLNSYFQFSTLIERDNGPGISDNGKFLSKLTIKAEAIEDAVQRESDIRELKPEDLIIAQDDPVFEVKELHEDETSDIGIFTTGRHVTFVDYEEYYFSTETEDTVFHIDFNLPKDFDDYDKLRRIYIEVMRSFVKS